MEHKRQFDGIEKTQALTEILKEFPAALLQNFEFDNDTQIATFDVRAMPVFDFDAGDESAESFDFNKAMEQVKETQKELQRRLAECDETEKRLKEKQYQLDELEKAIDTKQKQCDQSLAEIAKKTAGVWKRTKSFFHGIE